MTADSWVEMEFWWPKVAESWERGRMITMAAERSPSEVKNNKTRFTVRRIRQNE